MSGCTPQGPYLDGELAAVAMQLSCRGRGGALELDMWGSAPAIACSKGCEEVHSCLGPCSLCAPVCGQGVCGGGPRGGHPLLGPML